MHKRPTQKNLRKTVHAAWCRLSFQTPLLLIASLFLLGTTIGAGAQAIPQAGLSVAQTVSLGGDFSFTAYFDNVSSNATGYGPYVDIAYDRTGPDGSWDPTNALPVPGATNEFDGLTLTTTVLFLGSPLPASYVFEFTFIHSVISDCAC